MTVVTVAPPRRTEPSAGNASQGRSLRFLANVDPIDVARALQVCDMNRTIHARREVAHLGRHDLGQLNVPSRPSIHMPHHVGAALCWFHAFFL